MNLHQNDGKKRECGRNTSARDSKHTMFGMSIRHGDVGMYGTGSLVFIDDVTTERRSRVYCVVYELYFLLRFSQMLQN